MYAKNYNIIVVANGESSPSTCVISCVPQGSVLDPFIIIVIIGSYFVMNYI